MQGSNWQLEICNLRVSLQNLQVSNSKTLEKTRKNCNRQKYFFIKRLKDAFFFFPSLTKTPVNTRFQANSFEYLHIFQKT